VDVLPVGEPGRVRAGLEAWIEKRAVRSDLPEVTVAAARVLADELDADTSASPLWGRYTAILETLTVSQIEAQQMNAEMRAVVESVALAGRDEEWRAAKYREAVARDEDPTVWEKVVPIGCVRGIHKWRRPDYWRVVRCEYCETERES